jgi:beta-lactamase class D
MNFEVVILEGRSCLKKMTHCVDLHDMYADDWNLWLESSLKISPKEQVEVLSNIFNGKTHFSKYLNIYG